MLALIDRRVPEPKLNMHPACVIAEVEVVIPLPDLSESHMEPGPPPQHILFSAHPLIAGGNCITLLCVGLVATSERRFQMERWILIILISLPFPR